jgi:hypothetical protein
MMPGADADVSERTSLRQRAIHEYAHAVIARVLGQPVALVRPRFTTYRAPPRTAREFYRAALITLAGPAAEDRFCGYTRDQRAELWCGPVWGIDLLHAMHHLDAAGGGSMAPVKRAAERLVHAHWDAIERVAAALNERGELTGDKIDALTLPPYG